MKKICVVGLGYVGLPLAHAFSFKYDVVGYDIIQRRIDELKNKKDITEELTDLQLQEALDNNILFTTDKEAIRDSQIYIVTVPTPIKDNNEPDLFPLEASSKTIGSFLNKGDIVIYESTVYPGATEEVCVPILERESGLKFNVDFFCGYSPERINPGDKEHTVTNILKITSGSTPEIANEVDDLYKSIITAGTFKASSIKVAEAAKVIENTQRDVNIALMNELSMIFGNLGINTAEVLEAAGTKWNFIKLSPGLVGGHCISIDPHYLIFKSKKSGYVPDIIRTSRALNENMSKYIAEKLIQSMAKKQIPIVGAKVLIMGITFKENCPDIRNTKVSDLIHHLESYGIQCDVFDPVANPSEVKDHLGIDLIDKIDLNKYSSTILAVGHNKFKLRDLKEIKSYNQSNHIIFDLKSIYKIYDDESIINL